MKKSPKISRSFTWALLATIACNIPGSMLAMEQKQSLSQQKQILSPKKQNLVRRLVAAYNETMELRRKRKAGTATPAELKKLKKRMQKIKKAAIAAGVFLLFVAALKLKKYLEDTKPWKDAGFTSKEAKQWRSLLISEKDKKELKRLGSRTSRPESVKDAVKLKKLGITPLAIAVDIGNSRILTEFIRQHGQDVSAEIKTNPRLLHIAAIRDFPHITKILLELGADVEAPTTNYEIMSTGKSYTISNITPLHTVATRVEPRYSTEVAEALLQHGANVNAKDSLGNTPLHATVDGRHRSFRGYPERLIPTLLRYGADPLALNNKGQTPLDLAEEDNYTEAVALLKHALPLPLKEFESALGHPLRKGTPQERKPEALRQLPQDMQEEILQFVIGRKFTVGRKKGDPETEAEGKMEVPEEMEAGIGTPPE